MKLLETIVKRKEELKSVIEKRVVIENTMNGLSLQAQEITLDIEELEYQLQKQEENKIKNPVACLNPNELVYRGCTDCHFVAGCGYLGKGKKFRL